MEKSGLAHDRIQVLDVLRGFALFGILYAHLIIWYTGAAIPRHVYQQYDDTGSAVAFAIFGTFVLGKFFSVFSFLFGFSFSIQQFKTILPRENYFLQQSIRFLILILIGFIHHVFWRGDILMIYGVIAFALFLVVPISNRHLLGLALFFVLNIPEIIRQLLITPATGVQLPMEEAAQRYYEVIRYGNLAQVVRDNFLVLDNKLQFQLESGRLFRTLGFFLLGFYAGRNKIFSSAWKQVLLRIHSRLKVVLGIMVVVAIVLFAGKYVTFEQQRFESVLPLRILYDIVNVTLSLFYITGIYFLYQNKHWQKYLTLFSYPGRMALTSYLMQTVVGLILFHQFGFGLFDKTTPGQNVLMVIPVFVLQVLFSKWWLRHYSYGPMEWLWRSVTYLKIVPLRRASVAEA